MVAAISNVTANGIKFNGQNYDEWIEYVKLNAVFWDSIQL